MIEIHEVYPYLRVHDTAAALAFFRLTDPSGHIGHAEMAIGPTTVMLADENAEGGIHGPQSFMANAFGNRIDG